MPVVTPPMNRFDPRSIAADGLCSGCGACQVIAPAKVTMKLDGQGYLRPETSAPLDAAELARMREVCPGVGLSQSADSTAAVPYDPVWGPIKGLWAGHAVDEQTRYEGSSGGVLSAVMIHLLESGQVQGVLHTRASSADPLGNETVLSRNRADVLSGAGSRYAPASPVAGLVHALTMVEKLAFVGKPCDAAAVRNLIRTDPALSARIPFVLSFMCAGTPSRQGAVAVVRKMELPLTDVSAFRYRGNGWPGMTVCETRGGQRGELDYNTAWGTILNQHLQTRCKLCADGTGEFADLVGADAWYGKDGYPDFTEQQGRSLVVARTAAGAALLSQAVEQKSLRVEPFDVGQLRVIQPYQLRRRQAVLVRSLAVNLFGRRAPRYRGMKLALAAWQSGLKVQARELAGSLLRAWRGRL